MSNHRINIIAALSAIALCAVPPLTAQNDTNARAQEPSRSSSGSSSDTTRTEPGPSDSTTNERSTSNATPASAPTDSPTSNQQSTSASATPRDSDVASPASGASSSSQPTMAAGAGMSEVKRASDDAEDSAMSKLKGQRLRSGDGAELGKIHDFILDGSSGQIVHVVVSTGGVLGVGDKLRLLPPTGITQAAEGFTATLQQSEFEALPTVAEKDLKAGRIPAATGMKTQGAASDTAAAPMSTEGALVRASQLKGKSVRSDNNDVGKIDQVVIDLQTRKAMALIAANSGFSGESGKFLVPLKKLEVRSEEADSISSSLMRSDFVQDSRSTTAASAATASGSSTSAGAVSATDADRASSSQGATASAPTIPPSVGNTPTSSPGSSTSTTDGQTGRSESTQTLASSTSPATTSQAGAAAEPSTARTPATNEYSSTARDSSASVGSTGGRSETVTGSTTAAGAPASAGASGESATIATPSPVDPSAQVATGPSSPSATSTSPDASLSSDPRRSSGLGDTANAGTSVAGNAAASSSSTSTDDRLSPTGRTSADQNPASGATAMAIREALDNDATLAREDVQVTTKIVLRGSVQNEEAKKRVEELAKQAAGSAEIDNQITVK
jgi:sporulation protein YlmC with PRC-barrel domain